MTEDPSTPRTALPKRDRGRTNSSLQQELLFKTIFGGLEGYIGLFSSVPGQRKETGSVELIKLHGEYFDYPKQATQALHWAENAATNGRELHLCPHLLTKKRRIKRNAGQIKALWADADEATLPEGFPEPTLEIRSSPGQRHLYWRLSKSLSPAEAEEINRDLTHTIGADDGGWPLACMLRLPGTKNRKYDPPAPIEVISHDPTLTYHPREVAQYLVEPKPESVAATEIPDLRAPAGEELLTTEDIHLLSQKMRSLITLGNKASGEPYETRSHADFAVVIAMLGAGFTDEAIWQVFRDPANGISEKYFSREEYGDYYLNRTIREAKKVVEPAYNRGRHGTRPRERSRGTRCGTGKQSGNQPGDQPGAA